MGKEACLTAGLRSLPRLNPWVSIHINYYDLGDLLVHWDNGSSLNVVYGVDLCEKASTS